MGCASFMSITVIGCKYSRHFFFDRLTRRPSERQGDKADRCSFCSFYCMGSNVYTPGPSHMVVHFVLHVMGQVMKVHTLAPVVIVNVRLLPLWKIFWQPTEAYGVKMVHE